MAKASFRKSVAGGKPARSNRGNYGDFESAIKGASYSKPKTNTAPSYRKPKAERAEAPKREDDAVTEKKFTKPAGNFNKKTGKPGPKKAPTKKQMTVMEQVRMIAEKMGADPDYARPSGSEGHVHLALGKLYKFDDFKLDEIKGISKMLDTVLADCTGEAAEGKTPKELIEVLRKNILMTKAQSNPWSMGSISKQCYIDNQKFVYVANDGVGIRLHFMYKIVTTESGQRFTVIDNDYSIELAVLFTYKPDFDANKEQLEAKGFVSWKELEKAKAEENKAFKAAKKEERKAKEVAANENA